MYVKRLIKGNDEAFKLGLLTEEEHTEQSILLQDKLKEVLESESKKKNKGK